MYGKFKDYKYEEGETGSWELLCKKSRKLHQAASQNAEGKAEKVQTAADVGACWNYFMLAFW